MALTAGLSSIRCAGGIDDIDFLLPNVDDALERLAHATTVKGYLPASPLQALGPPTEIPRGIDCNERALSGSLQRFVGLLI